MKATRIHVHAIRVVFALLMGTNLAAGDWPQFRGLGRDGISSETLPSQLPKEGWKILWKNPAGDGFAGAAVSKDRAYLFHRVQSSELLEARDLRTGNALWKSSHPATYDDDFGFDSGPRCVPTVVGDSIVTLGADGHLACTSTNGEARWSVRLRTEYRADKGFFGFASSPLVAGDVVIVQAGGAADDAGIIGLDLKTGKLRWKATPDEAGYSSPVMMPGDRGSSVAACFNREGLTLVEVGTGRIAVRHPFRARMHASVNGASPVVRADRIFLTTSYGVGGVMLIWNKDRLETLWKNDVLASHFPSPVLVAENLYGFDGRQEEGCSFVCLDWETGKERWRVPKMGAGSVISAAGRLLLLLESGELVLADANPLRWEERGRWQAVGNGVRAHPALSGKVLVMRDKRNWVAVGIP